MSLICTSITKALIKTSKRFFSDIWHFFSRNVHDFIQVEPKRYSELCVTINESHLLWAEVIEDLK